VALVGFVIGAILLIWGAIEEKDKGPISWAEFVYANGGPGGVCDVAFSEVPTHLAEQWGRRCITGAGQGRGSSELEAMGLGGTENPKRDILNPKYIGLTVGVVLIVVLVLAARGMFG